MASEVRFRPGRRSVSAALLVLCLLSPVTGYSEPARRLLLPDSAATGPGVIVPKTITDACDPRQTLIVDLATYLLTQDVEVISQSAADAGGNLPQEALRLEISGLRASSSSWTGASKVVAVSAWLLRSGKVQASMQTAHQARHSELYRAGQCALLEQISAQIVEDIGLWLKQGGMSQRYGMLK